MDVSISIAVSKQERRLLVLLLLQPPSNVICDAFSFRCYENLGFCSVFVGITKFAESSTSIGNFRISPSKSTHNRARNRRTQKKHSMTSFAMAKWAHCIRITVSLNKRYLHSSTEFHICHYNNNGTGSSSRKENNNSSRNGNNKQKIFIRYIFASRNCSTVLNADSVWEANELKASSAEIFGREKKINHLTSFHMHCWFDSCRCRWVCVFVCFASFPLYSRFCRSLVLRKIDTLAIFFAPLNFIISWKEIA